MSFQSKWSRYVHRQPVISTTCVRIETNIKLDDGGELWSFTYKCIYLYKGIKQENTERTEVVNIKIIFLVPSSRMLKKLLGYISKRFQNSRRLRNDVMKNFKTPGNEVTHETECLWLVSEWWGWGKGREVLWCISSVSVFVTSLVQRSRIKSL